MYCPKCRKEVNGKFCPNCGTAIEESNVAVPQSDAVAVKKKKLKWWQVLLIVVGVIIVIGAIGSALGGNNDDGKKVDSAVTQTDESNNKTDDKKDETKTICSVGEVAKSDDVELSVVKVEKSQGSEYDKPKDGMEYVVVTVKYKNIGNDNISYNPFDFKIKNSKGQITSETFSTINAETALHSGELAPGGEIEGSLVFEQPINDELILQYTGNIWLSSSDLEFKLS